MLSQTDRQTELTGYPSIDKPWMKWIAPNADAIDMPKYSLYDSIWLKNKEHLSDVALHYFGGKITFSKLFEMIKIAEAKMISLGIIQGDRVGFISLTTPEMVAVMYALNKMGAAAVMMDPRTAVESLKKCIENAEIEYLIVQDVLTEHIGKLLEETVIKNVVIIPTATSMSISIKLLYNIKNRKQKFSFSHVCYEDIPEIKINNTAEIHADVENTLAIIIYTGGTTGESKGVCLSNGNINSIVEQFRISTGGFQRQQKWLTPAVPFIAYSLVCSLHMPLTLGMQCFLELYNVKKMQLAVKKHKIEHVSATPIFFEEFIKDTHKDYSYLIMPTTGADKLSNKTYDEVNAALKKGNCSWKLCNGYGMTEVSTAACASICDGCNKTGSVGIPFSHTIITAFDVETGQEVKQGEQGEICIAGPGVMLGYLNNPKATDDVIRIGQGRRWMHTGDIGHIDEDGCVFIDGRIKRMIVRYDGFKVFPTLIEEKLLASGAIENCCCVSIPDKEHNVGSLPVVFYVSKNIIMSKEITEEALKKTAKELLAEYSQPYAYYEIGELPYTHAGKVDYQKLEQMYSIENS